MLTQCLEFIKKYEIRDDLKVLLLPFLESFAEYLRPYLMIAISFVFLNFVILLYILFYLRRMAKEP
jgi:hypothetical protein